MKACPFNTCDSLRGVVLRNDAQGLEMRYNAPALRWRDILARLIAEDARQQTQPKKK